MANLDTGSKAPDFSLPASGDTHISLSDYKGQKLVLYFYPKDNTPGCTKESCGFNESLNDFNSINTAVLGVSKDSLKSHEKFINKYDLKFPLVSDEEGTMCEDYGVWVEKSMYGRTYMGIQRATFLIDENGVIEHIWPKVKVPGHVEDVLNVIKEKESKAA